MDILLALKASDKQIEEVDKQRLEKKAKDEKENIVEISLITYF